MRLAIENLAIVGEELAIGWNDRCPCAHCAGEKGILGEVYRSEMRLSAESFRLIRCAVMGGYAIQPEWADRHNSGIYSFDYLRSMNVSPEPEN